MGNISDFSMLKQEAAKSKGAFFLTLENNLWKKQCVLKPQKNNNNIIHSNPSS